MMLDELTERFATAHPALIASRSLQQRIDRKFLLAARHLDLLLPRLYGSFSALTAGPHRWARYDSLYFDTADRSLFHAHRCGRLPRFKVRIRRHLDRQLAFLEIKRKHSNGNTTKHRLPMPLAQTALSARELAFIAEHAPGVATAGLRSVMFVSFRRLTLVANDAVERLTLDRDLLFGAQARSESLAGVVVAEIKQEQVANQSGSVAAFRAARARQTPFSKYCIGTVMLGGVPGNVFKPGVRAARTIA